MNFEFSYLALIVLVLTTSVARTKAEEQAEVRNLNRQLWAAARKGIEVQRFEACPPHFLGV